MSSFEMLERCTHYKARESLQASELLAWRFGACVTGVSYKQTIAVKA